ncbi:hypothetical protein ACHQM5_014860 [Ranunculus cassubicifolius]
MYMDKATEAEQSLSYARINIEIDAEKELPTSYPLKVSPTMSAMIQIEYPWKPMICTHCKVFGHETKRCLVEISKNHKVKASRDLQNMYSSGNPTNIANSIKDANVQIDIKTAGGRLTLYQTTLCQIISLIDLRKNGAILDPQGYLDAYREGVYDTQLICCQSDASVLWTVPPSIQARFAKSIDIVANPPNPSEVQAVFNGSTNGFRIYEFYPRYFRVTGSGDIRLLEQTWWSFHDTNVSDVGGCAGPMAIVVSEETPQGILGETLSKFSIWGLYISFVLAVGRFIRLQCSDLRMRVPFENLPSCERLMAICEDIYAARAEGEHEIEEVLYWTLIKIYRSPHMLLEYTKLD